MKTICTVSLLFLSLQMFAQQDPLYSQYINNPFTINPAYAGFPNILTASVSYRQQWNGLEGDPQTINANLHTSLLQNKMGAGLMIISDRLGGTKTTEAFSSIRYRINITNSKIFSFGMQAGFTNYQFDNTAVNIYDQGDTFFKGAVNEIKPNIGFGAILSDDRFFVGLSVPRILKSTIEASGGLQNSLYTQHYYLMGSYIFIASERVRIKPSALIKLVEGAPASLDLNAAIIFNQNYQAGILTRNFNTYGISLMGIFSSFRFGYVMEVPTEKSVGTNFSTHELTVGFRTKIFSFQNIHSVASF
jgi:type IX secretion system PorP/SprF family membrane protein